ncbi:MAG: hypothetical protein ACXVQY_01810 [Actinomycetota bacterium]
MPRFVRGTESRARELALLGRPREALAALKDSRSEHGDWIRAYVAAATGDMADALARAERLAEEARRVEIRVAAALTTASVLRQLGRHREAMRFDRTALEHARTPSERTHAIVGLAADAVGTGRAGACGRLLADASNVVPADDWRAQVRLDWVRAEHALLTGRPAHGVSPARAALRIARDAGASRHIAKSQLFLGVCLTEAGMLVAGARALREARDGARACDAAPIAQVARDMLGRVRIRAAG